jgi:hypothetical protein
MSNELNDLLTAPAVNAEVSAEQISNLLLGGGDSYSMDDEESVSAYKQKLFADIKTLRIFAEANELDSQKIVAAITPYYVNKITTDLDHSFERLEAVAMERDTYVSTYIDENEASLVLWCCKEADGSQVSFDDISLPYHTTSQLGEDYRPKYSDTVVYGQSVDPMKAVKLYNDNKAEIVELNIYNCLRDVGCLFDYLIKYIKNGLNDEEIVVALENLDAEEELDNDVEVVAAQTPKLTP